MARAPILQESTLGWTDRLGNGDFIMGSCRSQASKTLSRDPNQLRIRALNTYMGLVRVRNPCEGVGSGPLPWRARKEFLDILRVEKSRFLWWCPTNRQSKNLVMNSEVLRSHEGRDTGGESLAPGDASFCVLKIH